MKFYHVSGMLVVLSIALVVSARANSIDEGVEAFEREDFARAIEILKPLAEQGDAGSQAYLGQMYLMGMGVRQDSEMAVQFITNSARQGHPRGQSLLGFWIQKGLAETSVREGNHVRAESEYLDAESWYSAAEKQGQMSAKYLLAEMYVNVNAPFEGNSTGTIRRLYLEAAEGRHEGAQFRLAELYREGKIFSQSNEQAIKWYQVAADVGHKGAIFRLGLAYRDGLGVAVDTAQALVLLEIAGEANFPDALLALGQMYHKGVGVTEDFEKAESFYERAREAGSTEGLRGLLELKADAARKRLESQ